MDFTYGDVRLNGSPSEAAEFAMEVEARQKRASEPKPCPKATVDPGAALLGALGINAIPCRAPVPEKKAPPAIPALCEAGSKRPSPYLPMPPETSFYYTAVGRSRRYALMAQTYEYVALFPEGVKREQVAAVFHESPQKAGRRLSGLLRQGFLDKPRGKYGPYVALYPNGVAAAVEDITPEQIIGNGKVGKC